MMTLPNRRALSWLLTMVLLLQALVALVHGPVFQMTRADSLAEICTPDGWKKVAPDAPLGKPSPLSAACLFCRTGDGGAVLPPTLAMAVPADTFLLVSASAPPTVLVSGRPPESPPRSRAPPSFA